MTPTHKHDNELGDLWSRRGDLSEHEWHRLYQIVWECLYPYRPAQLSSLPEERDEYVQCFFYQKAYPGDALSDGKRIHVGALKTFYRNFLIDRIRREVRDQQIYVCSTQEDDADFPGANEHNVQRDTRADPGESGLLVALREAGCPPERIAELARAWLGRMEDWVSAYLGLHFCPDAETTEPLVHLAHRLGIASYHYKATQLGINWDRDKQGSKGKRFSDTLLGKWATEDLGLSIDGENDDLLLAAFKILCHEALIRAEHLEAAS